MKKALLSFVLMAFAAFVANAQTTPAEVVDSSKMSEIKFEKTVHDYGKVPYGGDTKTRFLFKNTSKNPLILTNVRSSCGCTTPFWPNYPIEPGKTDSIVVSYNNTRVGMIQKTITVQSNAKNGTIELSIVGELLPEVAPAEQK